MPYMIVKKQEGDKQLWCVHKENADKEPGELVKCHESEGDAKEHMAAMYANADDVNKKPDGEKSLSDDALVAFGGEVKSLGENRIGGYLILFGSPDQADLTGDYFTKDTDFGPHKTSLVFYDHGLDGAVKRRVLDDSATLKVDDVGVWVEAQLRMRDEYERAIHSQLIKASKAGWSSGTATHLVERERKGNAWHITKWPLGLDASITVCPTEPRLASAVVPLKSLSAHPLEIQQAQTQAQDTGGGQSVASSASSAESNAGSQPTQTQPQQSAATKSVPDKGVTMDEKEMQALMEKMGSLVDVAGKAVEASTASNKSIADLLERLKKEPATQEGGFVTGKSTGIQVTLDEADRPFESMGHELMAIKTVRTSEGTQFDPRLKRLAVKATGANENIGSEGGFLLEPQFDKEVLKPLHDEGVFTKNVKRLPVGTNSNSGTILGVDETNRATGSRWGGIRGYRAAEGGSITASKPAFREIAWKLKKYVAAVYATDELLMDAAQFAAVVNQGVSEEFDFMANDDVLNGDGVAGPKGILNSQCLVTVAKETGQAAATICNENLMKMWTRVHPRSKANSVWYYNTNCGPQLHSLALEAGTSALEARFVTYAPDGSMRVYGRPAVETEFSASLGTVGDIMVADMSQYLYWEKGGVQSAQSIHVQFLYDESVFRFIYRLDGKTALASALTPYKGTSDTLSPFVVLAARA